MLYIHTNVQIVEQSMNAYMLALILPKIMKIRILNHLLVDAKIGEIKVHCINVIAST